MTANRFARTARAAMAAVAVITLLGTAQAQQPSPAAVGLARELAQLKGTANMFDPILIGVFEQAKGFVLQTNPGLSKEMDEVLSQLRAEYAPQTAGFANDIAQSYARRFTEQELKDLVAFFKTPTGRKLIAEEPKVVDESFLRVQQWASKLPEEVLSKVRAEMKKRGHNL